MSWDDRTHSLVVALAFLALAIVVPDAELSCFLAGISAPRLSKQDREWLEREEYRAEAEQYLEEAIQAAGNYYRA